MLRTVSFRDPIHGDITLRRDEDAVILDVIDTPEFQRMRRIRQMSVASLVFHGAEHSRFTHLLGAFALMRRILDHLSAYGEEAIRRVVAEHRRIAELAALLHDIGHGPFSHAFEHVLTSQHHEETGRQIILGDTGVRTALQRHGVDPAAVVAIQTGDAAEPFLSQLLSSQIDCDRMDYLLRDMYMTGARAGLYDLDRLVRAFTVVNDEGKMALAVTEKGFASAEAFLLARLRSYEHIYQHKTNVAAEHLLIVLLRRAAELARAGTVQIPHAALATVMLENRLELSTIASLDDTAVYACVQHWMNAEDPILADLASRFLNRRLPKAFRLETPLPEEQFARIRGVVAAAGFEPDVYCAVRSWTFTPLPVPKHPRDEVRVLTSDGLRPITDVSLLLGPWKGRSFARYLLLVPAEVRTAVGDLLVA